MIGSPERVLLARIGNGRPRVVFNRAYGLADRERKIANTLDTRFRLGSMNKMFTAVSILQLVLAGKIKLADPVGKYVPDYPNRDVASKVTIHHLLTHTGGTGDFFGPAEYTALLITGKVSGLSGRMYAYGFEDSRKDGSGAAGHGGGAPGMNGELRIYPKSGYVVAVLSNLDPPTATQVSEFLDLRLPR